MRAPRDQVTVLARHADEILFMIENKIVQVFQFFLDRYHMLEVESLHHELIGLGVLSNLHLPDRAQDTIGVKV